MEFKNKVSRAKLQGNLITNMAGDRRRPLQSLIAKSRMQPDYKNSLGNPEVHAS